jgi:hypothetical protein
MLRRVVRLTPLLVCGACLPIAPLTCGPQPDVSPYGSYAGPFKIMRLASGDTFTVYRVKSWTFTEGGSALQLEYQTHVDVDDTVAVKAEAGRVWSVFGWYVDQTTLTSAILTATDRRVAGGDIGHVSRMRSFGVSVTRNSSGKWQQEGESKALPEPVDVGSLSQERVGIFERNGQPLVIPEHLRAHTRLESRTLTR